ncbi:MAG: MaoC/PaaZ C-terminal domain-containing protein [Polyangiales bacterium]
MPLKPDAVGQRTETFTFPCRWQDCALYALGVGATESELPLLYEGHKSEEARGVAVLPSFAVVPGYAALEALFALVDGDLLGVVHAGQELTVHQSLPSCGMWHTVGEVVGVYDLKRMAQAVFRTETRNAEGALLAECTWTMLYRFDGGFGGQAPPRSARVKVPERAPDFTVEAKTLPQQALLYRLCGDHNPLHADPAVGQKAGFEGTILHGLCTYGYLARAVVQQACDGDPTRLKRLSAQFRKPVFPGDTLISEGWHDGAQVLLRVRTAARPDDAVITQSVAEVG